MSFTFAFHYDVKYPDTPEGSSSPSSPPLEAGLGISGCA
jgi:hypothetical protein